MNNRPCTPGCRHHACRTPNASEPRPRAPEPEEKPRGGHYTGRCGRCGSSNLWDDATAYGCNGCGAVWIFG